MLLLPCAEQPEVLNAGGKPIHGSALYPMLQRRGEVVNVSPIGVQCNDMARHAVVCAM